MRPRDGSWPKRFMAEADEQFVSAVGSLAGLAAGEVSAPAGWWRRRQLERALDTELRTLGLRVMLSEGGVVLFDPALREQAAEARRRWQELHPAAPAQSPTPTKDLLASVEELRRRLGELGRVLEARPTRPRPAERPAVAAANHRGERRAARRR
jgi:hypothetical protein